jgi:uncharacterized RDD family membrane protein YckC
MKHPPVERRSRRAAATRAAAVKQQADPTLPDEEPEFQQGTLWARISARSGDILLLLLPWYFLWGQAFTTTETVASDGTVDVVTTTNAVYLWLAVALVMLYEIIFTATWGRTPGKRMMGLGVVNRLDGSPPGWGQAFMRATPLLLAVAVLLLPVLWLGSVVAMRFDRLQRSVFDFSGSTVVVAVPRSGG